MRLTVDGDENLYVTTRAGGKDRSGTIVKLTPNVDGPYTVSTLFTFDAYTNNVSGRDFQAPLTYDSTKKVLYGTAYLGGTYDIGTLFQKTRTAAGSPCCTLHRRRRCGLPERRHLVSLGQLYGETNGYHTTHSPIPGRQYNNGCGTLFKFPAS